MFVQFYFGPIFALPLDRYGARMMGTLSGVGNFFANLGAFSFTYLLGALKNQTGHFGSGFYRSPEPASSDSRSHSGSKRCGRLRGPF